MKGGASSYYIQLDEIPSLDNTTDTRNLGKQLEHCRKCEWIQKKQQT